MRRNWKGGVRLVGSLMETTKLKLPHVEGLFDDCAGTSCAAARALKTIDPLSEGPVAPSPFHKVVSRSQGVLSLCRSGPELTRPASGPYDEHAAAEQDARHHGAH